MKIVSFIVLFISILLCESLNAEMLKLVNGDTINVNIIKENSNEYVVEHEILGQITISKSDVVLPEVKKTDKPTEKADVVPPKVEKHDKPIEKIVEVRDTPVQYRYLFESDPEFIFLENLAHKIKETGWRMHLNLSMNSSSGNTKEQSWRFGYGAKKKNKDNSFTFNSTYYRKQSHGALSDNKLTLETHNDWLDPESKWFCFIDARYDYDQFNSWDQRFAGEIGPGYHLIDNKLTKLDLLLGFGPKKEWGSQNSKLKTEYSSKLSLDWKISPRQKIIANTSYKMSRQDESSYRVLSLVKWRYLLDRELNLSFNAGLEHEYQSVVDPGREKSDFRMYTGLQINF